MGKKYKHIVFKNGYAKNAPEMTIEYLDLIVKEIYHPINAKTQTVLAIKLGKILDLKNCDQLVSNTKIADLFTTD